MVIATSITESYLERSKPFFESCNEHWPGKRICFTIGFSTTIEGWECIETQFPECEWKPTNRPEFHTLQHGEFVKYIPDTDPDEMILFIDSDMVLQRKWDITVNSTRAVTVTASSWPQTKLWDVICNLGVTHKKRRQLVKEYLIHEKVVEFCSGFIIASFDQWENIYRGCRELYPFLNNFKHHAAWQLLINLVVLNSCPSVRLAPEHIVNATWYTGTRAKGEPLSVTMMGTKTVGLDIEEIVSEEVVYFNHTKFN